MLLAAGFAFSLLCGTAQAQDLDDYAKPALRPPVSAASPYGEKSKGTYVLPGTFTKKGELPPLPKKEQVRVPPPSQPEKKLPDIRTLSELSDLHPAETPQTFRAATPATRGAATVTLPQSGYTPRYRPAPVPLVVPPVVDAPAEGEWITLDAPSPAQVPVPLVVEHAPVSPTPQRPVVTEHVPPAPIHLPSATTARAETPAAPPVISPAPQQPRVAEYVPPAPVHQTPAVTAQDETPSLAPVVSTPQRPVVTEYVPTAPAVTAQIASPPVDLDIPAAPPVATAPDAPVIVQKRTIMPEPAVPPVEPPPFTLPLTATEPVATAQKQVTEIIEIPESETDAALEVPTETSLLVPVEPIAQQELSPASQEILHKTPSGIDSPKTVVKTPKPIVMTRSEKPDALDVRTHESLGMKIEVRKAPPNVAAFLQQGYDHLMAGNLSIAAGFYEQAVQTSPRNEQALFGLATTYQRIGRRDEARDIYGKLLGLNPTHREGLNNFMVLLADEAPLAAIEALEQLETENPDFSPIPAQLGSVYNRVGNHEMAARKLARALQLSPDNLAYKYNLAIALDKLGDKKQASDLYMELIEAYNLGGILPGDVDDIRNRVIFLNR